MSKINFLNYTYDKNFKHKRHEYGYLNKGVCIEIGWKGVFEGLIAWIRGDKV